MFHTPRQPMRGFVDEMQEREGQGGVLSLSLIHGFPWGDHPRSGARMLAITDADAPLAQAVAGEFGQKLWQLRHDLPRKWPDMGTALDAIKTARKYPLVLADFADNAGGGAPSDSTYFLQVVRHRGLKDIALGLYWDPALVQTCQEVGVGTHLDVRLGGKVGRMSGEPVDLKVKVRAIREGMTQTMGETVMPMGTGVWLESDGLHLVVCSIRTQCFAPEAFSDLGVPLDRMKAIIVKSSQHFHAGFAPIAAQIIQVATPGTLCADLSQIPFVNRKAAYWPDTETPFDD